jgi:hypothetical protein
VEISAILLARSIALFDVTDLNPRGKVFFPKLVPMLVERFSFQKYPIKLEEFDASKGISFDEGYFEGHTVSNFTLYNDGIKMDLQTSTEDAQSLIEKTLHWLVEAAGITYSDGMIKRWGFLSNIIFHSDIDLDVIHPALRDLAKEVTLRVEERTGLPLIFKTSGISFNFERVNGDIPISNFSIERRAKTRHSEGKYFSAAPLQTEAHIKLLREFEDKVIKSQ